MDHVQGRTGEICNTVDICMITDDGYVMPTCVPCNP